MDATEGSQRAWATVLCYYILVGVCTVLVLKWSFEGENMHSLNGAAATSLLLVVAFLAPFCVRGVTPKGAYVVRKNVDPMVSLMTVLLVSLVSLQFFI